MGRHGRGESACPVRQVLDDPTLRPGGKESRGRNRSVHLEVRTRGARTAMAAALEEDRFIVVSRPHRGGERALRGGRGLTISTYGCPTRTASSSAVNGGRRASIFPS
jgi:hypothetical protein